MDGQDLSSLLDACLQFDPPAEIDRITAFIRSEVNRRGVRGVLIGLSGGLDSTACACLCARALPPGQVHLVSLPERDSSPAPQGNAQTVARSLHLPLEERDLTETFHNLGLYQGVPVEVAQNRPLLEKAIRILGWLSGSPAFYPWAQQYAFGRRKGLLAWLLRRRLWRYAGDTEKFIFGKVRTRMLVLSTLAMQRDCLLVCTTDRSEVSVGFYDPHGDGVGDIAPLIHLYKTQIRTMAQTLGVPEEILTQPSSGDLAAGLPNETAMGLSYEQLDRVLAGFSIGMTDVEAASAVGLRQKMVRDIRSACALADQRRGLPRKIADTI